MSYKCTAHGWSHLLNPCPSCQPEIITTNNVIISTTPKNSVDELAEKWWLINRNTVFSLTEAYAMGYKAAQAATSRLKLIIAKELSENDELGSEFTYVNVLKDEIKTLSKENADLLLAAKSWEREADINEEASKLYKKKLEIAKDALDEIQGITIWGLKQDATDGIEPIDWRYYAQKALKQIEEIGK